MKLSCIVAGVIALGVSADAGAAEIVPVRFDAFVNAANPDGALGHLTTGGGVLVGLDDTGSDYKSFLQFVLPASTPPFSKAVLKGTYTQNYGGSDPFIGAFFVADDGWNESEITFNNAPSSSDYLGGFSTSLLSPPTQIEIDLTARVQEELAGDRVLSVVLQTIDGRFGDLKYFASHEFDSSQAFVLELTALPEPGVVGVVSILSALLVRRTRR